MSEQQTLVMEGFCLTFLEQGMEGIAWAFQDKRFINVPEPDKYTCMHCHVFWDKARDKEIPQHAAERNCAHDWKPAYPSGSCSYEGLHFLNSGDFLEVFARDDPNVALFARKLKFDETYGRFVVRGNGHGYFSSLPVRVPKKKWITWFEGEYPARLTLSPESYARWEKYSRAQAEEVLKQLGRL